VRAGVERVLVAGGDGTLSEVVTGLLDAGLAGYASVGLIPLGTGGDFARGLGLPRDPRRAVAALGAGKTRRVDAGRASYRGRDGRERTTCFLNVASAGISGLVDELVQESPRVLGGTGAFLLAALRAIASYRSAPSVIRIDGEVAFEGSLGLAVVANGRYFGGGMHVAPDARIDDGLFEVVVVGDLSKPALLAKLPKLYRGAHLRDPDILHRRGGRIELDAPEGGLPIDLDGEPLGELPARIELLPGAISLLEPAA
jgi:YegS/Rv2252/BmrU family lipid kinase